MFLKVYDIVSKSLNIQELQDFLMKRTKDKATVLLVMGNTLLFILKLIIGVISNSIAIISDAINSFTDIIASFVVLICVRLGYKKPDENHPFGHHRIEPIAGLVVAIFIAIVGFEVINLSIRRLISGETILFSWVCVAILIFTMIFKSYLALHLRKVSEKTNSPAIKASSIDCRNDVFISGAALLGIVAYYFGYPYFDPIVGVIIGMWIIYSGYDTGKNNIDYLIGRAPSKKTLKIVKKVVMQVKGVKGLHDMKAHYVGNYVHVEVHIELNKKLSLTKAHNIGRQVRDKLEKLSFINEAFVHVDPV